MLFASAGTLAGAQRAGGGGTEDGRLSAPRGGKGREKGDVSAGGYLRNGGSESRVALIASRLPWSPSPFRPPYADVC
jgi:hypothetical protein